MTCSTGEYSIRELSLAHWSVGDLVVVGRQRGGITRSVSRDADRRVAENRSGREDTVSLERADRPREPTAWTDRRPRSGRPPPFHHLLPDGSWEARREDARARCARAHRRMEWVGWPLCHHLHTGAGPATPVHTTTPHLEFPFHTRRRPQPPYFFISFIRYTHTAMRRASRTQLSLKASTNSGFLVSTNKNRSGRARVVLSPQCRAVRSLLLTNDRSKGREMAGTRRILGQRLQLRFSPTVPGRPLTTYVPHPLTHPPTVPDYHRRARCDRCRSR